MGTDKDGETESKDPIWECLKPATTQLKCGSAHHFDTRGDLILEVGPDGAACDFVVCSRTLARWSSVFGAMLFGGFAESQPPDAAWRVKLPEDRPWPLFLNLAILHGYFEHVPATLTLDQLYQVLVVTEKYDMTKILRPWARTWFSPYQGIASVRGNEILLWISWELGAEDTFRRLAKDLQVSSTVNVQGQLVSSDGVALNTYTCLEPPESITKNRKSVIEEMTQIVHGTLKTAYTSHRCKAQAGQRRCAKCGYDYSKLTELECNVRRSKLGQYYEDGTCGGTVERYYQVPPYYCGNFIFGSLVKLVEKIGLRDVAFLQNSTPIYNGSIKQLLAMLCKMALVLPAEHQICDPLPTMRNKVEKLVQGMSSPVTTMHVEYLRNQAKKTGIH